MGCILCCFAKKYNEVNTNLDTNTDLYTKTNLDTRTNLDTNKKFIKDQIIKIKIKI